MTYLELRIPPLVLLLITTAMMTGVVEVWPAAKLTVPGRCLVTSTLALAGCGLALAGVFAFRRAGTTVDPRLPARTLHIVKDGIYQRTRNPMYVGFVLLLAAYAVHLAHPGAALGVPLFAAWLQRFQIEPEERILAQRFGAAFHEYCRHTPRWL